MNFKNAIKQLFAPEQKDMSDSRTLMQLIDLGNPGWTESGYTKIANQGYAKNPTAHRCIDLISDAIATLPWIVRDASGNEVESGPIIDLLKRPNPEQGTASFFYEMEMYKLIDGNSFIQAVKPSTSAPKELFLLRPDRVKVVPGEYRLPAAFEYRTAKTKTTFEVDALTGDSDVLQIKTANPLNDWRGLSPLSVAMMSVDLFNTGVTWNQKLLKNGARPMGMFSTDQELTAGQRIELKNSLEQYQGAVNTGKPMITEGGLKFQSIGLTVVDADFIEGKKSAMIDIASSFGVPPQLAGLTDSSTYNNVKEAKLELYNQVILPEAEIIITEFNHWLMPMFGDGYELAINMDEIQALQETRNIYWEKIESATFLTDNEKRELLGFEPLAEEVDEVDDDNVDDSTETTE